MAINKKVSGTFQKLSKKYNEVKPLLSFFATSSLYGISIALLLSVFLVGSLMLISR